MMDFSDVNLDGFEPLPKGTYNVEISTEKADEVKVGGGKGTEYITLTFNVLDGEYAGRKIFENFMVTGKGVFKLGQLLKVVGLLTDSNRSNFKFDTFDLEGKQLRIVVGERVYEDKTYNEVKSMLPLNGNTPTPKAGRKLSGF